MCVDFLLPQLCVEGQEKKEFDQWIAPSITISHAGSCVLCACSRWVISVSICIFLLCLFWLPASLHVATIRAEYGTGMRLSQALSVNTAVTSAHLLRALEINLTLPVSRLFSTPFSCLPHFQFIPFPSSKQSSCFFVPSFGNGDRKVAKTFSQKKSMRKKVVSNYCVSNITFPLLQPSSSSLIYHSR